MYRYCACAGYRTVLLPHGTVLVLHTNMNEGIYDIEKMNEGISMIMDKGKFHSRKPNRIWLLG